MHWGTNTCKCLSVELTVAVCACVPACVTVHACVCFVTILHIVFHTIYMDLAYRTIYYYHECVKVICRFYHTLI